MRGIRRSNKLIIKNEYLSFGGKSSLNCSVGLKRHISIPNFYARRCMPYVASSKNQTLLGQKNFGLFTTTIGIIIFIAAAIASTYFYFKLPKNAFTLASIYPGVIYACATVVMFLVVNKITSVLNLIYYCCLMIVTYYVIWILTIYSSYIAFFVGIFTAGAGSLIIFFLADKFITKISYNKRNVFIIGGLSFFITDILLFSWNSFFEVSPVEYIFKWPSTDSIYGEVIFFWQLLVGVKLVLTLQKAKQRSLTSEFAIWRTNESNQH
jgi:hypothetical protein